MFKPRVATSYCIRQHGSGAFSSSQNVVLDEECQSGEGELGKLKWRNQFPDRRLRFMWEGEEKRAEERGEEEETGEDGE